MHISDRLFGGLTPEAFLAEYWQKKPLLVRGAFPGFSSPISPEELATLACDEAVQARLVLEHGGDYPWELRYGPFDEEDFESLPESHWTLLVQEVDRHVPEAAALMETFSFLPNWRLDDVMVSYAPGQGGVGAHIDNYDVFLIQGLGRRRWQINHTPVVEEHLVPNLDVSVLADFVPDAEWILEPGDLLYLPPRVPHFGVALDVCMTYSVGLKAPSYADLAAGFLEHVLVTADPLSRFGDPARRPVHHPGEIDSVTLVTIRSILRDFVRDDATLDDWFGRFITASRRENYIEKTCLPDEIRDGIRNGSLRRRARSHMAYRESARGAVTLYAAGEAYPLADELSASAALLTGTEPLTAEMLVPFLDRDDFVELLSALVTAGVLGWEN